MDLLNVTLRWRDPDGKDLLITRELLERERKQWGSRGVRPCLAHELWSDRDALLAWLLHFLPVVLIAQTGEIEGMIQFERFPLETEPQRGSSADFGMKLMIPGDALLIDFLPNQAVGIGQLSINVSDGTAVLGCWCRAPGPA